MHFLFTARMIAGLPCRQGQPHLGANCSLSPPQSGQAMEEFIQESLAAGIIRPSSPAGTGFFMEKKDKSLCPCIDYWGLNNTTIKNRYPLSLISTAFELLDGMVHFIPLPLAKEMAEALINHVFRVHGFLEDVVSDRGPHFMSKFCKEFCAMLWATVSLLSGFHPQSKWINQTFESRTGERTKNNRITTPPHLFITSGLDRACS